MKEGFALKEFVLLASGPFVALVFFLTPAPSGFPPPAWLMLGLVLWMVIWWLGELVPLAATALLPIPLLPALGIMKVNLVTASYGHKFIFIFLGGFLLAAAMQRWGLHKRIALNVIARFGTGPQAIIAGFMVATAFLSMWISNTATTIMMFAVAVSLVNFLSAKSTNAVTMRAFAVSLLLGIAYAASIGGVGTLIGTAPNAFIAGYLEDAHQIEISFVDWMKIGVPVVLTMLPLTWLLLTQVLFRVPKLDVPGSERLVSDELAGLGPMNKGERAVLIAFTLAALCWIFGKQISVLTGLPLTDAGVAIGAAILLFAWPLSLKQREFVLTANELQSIPWGILILLGGGIALAGGMKASGLADWIGASVASFGVTQWSLVAVGALLIVYLTELTSNVASTTTFCASVWRCRPWGWP